MTTGSKLGKQRKSAHESDSSSEDYEDEENDTAQPPSDASPVLEKSWQDRPSTSILQSATGIQDRVSADQNLSQNKEKSLSPSIEDSNTFPKSRSTSASLSGKLSTVSTNTSQETRSWSHLPHDVQYYLDYYQEHITHHHYFFKHDANNFVHSILLEIAPGYEPLLYAVVGFAAFQAALKYPNGKIQDFLGYYNKSVSLLRKSLQAHGKHTDATMLTILQLAAFEVHESRH